jgi:hypothetical protein
MRSAPESGDVVFAQVLFMFELPINGKLKEFALVLDYYPAPAEVYNNNNQAVGMSLWILQDPSYAHFTPINAFIRCAFLVSMADNRINHFHLNDVIDPDMYFWLDFVRLSLATCNAGIS